MFIGFVALNATIKAVVMTKNASDVPTNGDALPTYRIYGPSGIMTNGTGSAALHDTGTITAASNASPIVITSAAHGLSTGARVTITGVGGNTAANGSFNITVLTANTFSLDSSTGNGAYTSGGTWNVSGAYSVSITPTAANGYEAGKFYTVLFTSVVSTVTKVDQRTFGVV